jgi:hypothetical protein
MASEDDEINELEAKMERLRGLKRSYTGDFLGIAVDALASAEKASALSEYASGLVQASQNPAEEDHFVNLLVQSRLMRQHVATAVVFSALCVESAINFALDAKLSKFYITGLDKLDVPTKWVVVLKLAYEHPLEPSDMLVCRIKALAKSRNELVHAKPRTLVDNDLKVVKDASLSVDAARDAVSTARDAIAYLKGIDPHLSEWATMTSEWDTYGSVEKPINDSA